MKKYVPAVPVVLFPYVIVFVMYCIFSGFLMESVFRNNAFVCLLLLAVFWLGTFVCARRLYANSQKQQWDVIELCRANMLIKLISVPAYITIFLFGIVCMITIITVPISFVLMILDVLSIVLSGLIGIAAVKRCRDNEVITGKKVIIWKILQFIFCVDVISSIILYRKVKKV